MTDFKCKDPFKRCDDWECQKAGKCQSDAKTLEISHLTDDDFLVVHDVIEHDDGTASIRLDIGKNVLQMLVNVGFNSIIRYAIRNEGAVKDMDQSGPTEPNGQ